METYTFDETAERLAAYEVWAQLMREGGGRELHEGPDEASAKPLTAPGPSQNLLTHEPGRYSVHQVYDAYSICKMLAALVRHGSHLFSKGPADSSLRTESQLEFRISMLSRR